MTPLPSQEFFESLLKKDANTVPIVIIKFTASWCGPCKRINTDMLLGLSDKIVWYECDIDELDYTAGYAGVRTIPAFLAIVNGTAQPLLPSSDTMKVVEWI